ncbi:MAG: Y-family DNA polymerase [Bacteroidota bacterium]|nr:Y-family DNA polymerase [Bacteroidota bacterium]
MYALVDCNSFYCSCERVFRPHLDEKPVVVLSNNDGCIISRSDEAKQLGVGMAGPYFLAKPLIDKHGVEIFSSNYNLYGDMSWRVMEILKQTVGNENVEVYSVDEAFLNLQNFTLPQLEQLAKELRDKICKWTGIKVSVGVASTKTLSKMANKIAKDDKQFSNCVTILETEEKLEQALRVTRVGSLWGVGSRYADKLHQQGFTTAWDLRNLSEEWARQHLGGVVGVRLVKELRGENAVMMKEELDKKKMIATTRMFGNTVTSLSHIKEAVATYASRAAEKLRRQHSAASVLNVFLISNEKGGTARFKHGPTYTKHFILPYPSSATNELIKPAISLAEQLYQPGMGYKKAGIILSGLVPDDAIQANLFEAQKSVGRFLMEQIDNINFSMRNDMVKFASSGTKRDWKMRRDFQSPRYTTRWDELYNVK